MLLVVIGSGRWFQPKITIETYFDESVQGLDIGSKVKYRGVVIGEVTKIGFTYVRYQLDRPISERAALRAGRGAAAAASSSAAGRRRRDHRAPRTPSSRSSGACACACAPQGITGTNYLETRLRRPAAAAAASSTGRPSNVYIPSAPSTVLQFVNAASELIERLHKLDVEGTVGEPQPADGHRPTTASRRSTPKALSRRADRVLAKVEATLDGIADAESSPTRAWRCSPSCARPTPSSGRRWRIRRCRSCPRTRRRRWRACARSSTIPTLPRTLQNLVAHARAPRPHPRRRRGGSRDDDREPAPDHRQPARPHRGHQALSGERVVRRTAAAPPGRPPMMIAVDCAVRWSGLRRGGCVAAACCSRRRLLAVAPAPVKHTFLLDPPAPARRAPRAAGDAARRHHQRRGAVPRPRPSSIARRRLELRSGLLQRVPGRAGGDDRRGDRARARPRRRVRRA